MRSSLSMLLATVISLTPFAGALVASPQTPPAAQANGDSNLGSKQSSGNGLMLADERVRKELGVTDDQMFALAKLMRDTPRFRPSVEQFRMASVEQREILLQEMKEKTVERQRRLLDKVLSPAQIERHEQLALQLVGTRALGDKRILDQLGVSAEQREGIKAVNALATKEIDAATQEFMSSKSIDVMKRKVRAARQKADQTLMIILTEDQIREFNEMKGEPFQF